MEDTLVKDILVQSTVQIAQVEVVLHNSHNRVSQAASSEVLRHPWIDLDDFVTQVFEMAPQNISKTPLYKGVFLLEAAVCFLFHWRKCFRKGLERNLLVAKSFRSLGGHF